MSLHDIFMQRAALEHQNMLNSDTTGLVLQSLADGVAKGIEAQRAEVQKQRDEERDYQRSVSLLNEKARLEEKLLRSKNDMENEGLIRSRQLMIEKEELENKSTKIRSELEKQKLIALNDADLQKRKELIAEQGRVDAGLIKLRSELNDAQATMKPDDLYRQESLAIRRENLEQKIKEERRRVLTQKLSNAKSFGGVLSEDDMNALTQEVGFDIGTDVNTGRIVS